MEVVTDNGDVDTLGQAKLRDHCERQSISEVLEAAKTGPVTLEVASCARPAPLLNHRPYVCMYGASRHVAARGGASRRVAAPRGASRRLRRDCIT